MADTTISVKIGDIAKQLTSASEISYTSVADGDFFWVLTNKGQSVEVPAEFVRAYLSSGLKPTVGDDGYWYVAGTSTGVKAEGVTPQLRGGTLGIEVSYDKGETWQQCVAYSEMDIDLEALEEEYKKVTENEATRESNEETRIANENTRISNEESRKSTESSRATAESDRQTAEAARITAENGRVDAESKRVTAENDRVDAEAARVKAENARVTAESSRATAESDRQTAEDKRENIINHPSYIGDDGYWYNWDYDTQTYKKTDRLGTGGVIYPTFAVLDNCLYVGDGEDDNLADRVKIQDNSLVLIME